MILLIENNDENNFTAIVDKYVIFSRSSSDIIRLEQNKIKQIVNIENLPIKFLKLENFHSFLQLKNELKLWYNSGNGGFLFISIIRDPYKKEIK